MALKLQKLSALAQIIATYVPFTALADVLAEHGIVKNFDEMRKLAPENPAQNSSAVSQTVVDEYAVVDRVRLLVDTLSRELRGDDAFATRIAEWELLGELPMQGSHQAAIAKRANTLDSPALRRFLDENDPRICLIAGVAEMGGARPEFPRGTGFLVGPDLVITARHVLAYHLDGGMPRNPWPGDLCAFFDHFDGEPIEDPRKPTIRARRVEFHPTEWLQAYYDAMDEEGRVATPSEAQIRQFQENVDTVLIKLAEPIGAHTRRLYGGARRGWISLPNINIPGALRVDDRIIIPQHPSGFPLQIDLGRYKGIDLSGTRIRYNTETEEGTSGAPCFNQGFQLVGMHVAAYEPPGAEKLNQAVRFDYIVRRVEAKVGMVIPASSRLWSVAEDKAEPEVIVGRSKLLEWIKAASTDTPASRADRVYAADTELRYSGKSFSLKILKAALRNQPEQFVAMGNEHEALPKTARDFLAVIADQLKIPLAELSGMPARPTANLLGGMGEEDKLNTWISKDLPKWFDGVLGKHRSWMVDLRKEAQEKIERFKKAGLKPLSHDEEVAQATDKYQEARSRWERVWIVVDNFNPEKLDLEVRELIAGLVGARREEFAQHGELRRLRWMFLGKKPAFLGEVSSEVLDQRHIPDEDIAECIRAFAESRASAQNERVIDAVMTYVRVRLIIVKGFYDDIDTRLAILQQTIGDIDKVFTNLTKQRLV